MRIVIFLLMLGIEPGTVWIEHYLNYGLFAILCCIKRVSEIQDTVEVREVPDIPQSLIKVSIKLQFVGELPLSDAIEAFKTRGGERPQDPINALNIILG